MRVQRGWGGSNIPSDSDTIWKNREKLLEMFGHFAEAESKTWLKTVF